jgi:trimethylamine--corrinoid protein Co-methyltransferase
MALSDSKFVDAQGGAEAFAGALLAALAGVNSVSGPGMLDYVLVFSLEKLVFDNEVCAQALHFVRDYKPMDDLPTIDLVRQLLDHQHLLIADHTLKYWPEELYLPGPAFDRLNRDTWHKAGEPTLHQRPCQSSAFVLHPVETDPGRGRNAPLINLVWWKAINCRISTGNVCHRVLPPKARRAARAHGRGVRKR